MELHIIPTEELHDISDECDCGYEVMGFSNGIIIIHQSHEGSFAFDTMMHDLGVYRDYVLCEVQDETEDS